MPRSIRPVKKGIEDPDICFDSGSPFDVEHFGRLEYPEGTSTFGKVKPPRAHCVVTLPSAETLGVVRFTRHGLPSAIFSRLVPDVDSATELHARHLQKLGQCGILPWVSDIGISRMDASSDIEGIGMLQEVLPTHAATGIHDPDTYDRTMSAYEAYMCWATSSHEPVYLGDLRNPDQYSILEGMVVLHDVEPLYLPNPDLV